MEPILRGPSTPNVTPNVYHHACYSDLADLRTFHHVIPHWKPARSAGLSGIELLDYVTAIDRCVCLSIDQELVYR
jgi:hypothetical protein